MEPDFPNGCMVFVKSNSDFGEPPLGGYWRIGATEKFLKKICTLTVIRVYYNV